MTEHPANFRVVARRTSCPDYCMAVGRVHFNTLMIRYMRKIVKPRPPHKYKNRTK